MSHVNRYRVAGAILIAATCIGLYWGYEYYAPRYWFAQERLREYGDDRFPRSNDVFSFTLRDVAYDDGVSFRCTLSAAASRRAWLERSSFRGAAFFFESDGVVYELAPDPTVLIQPAGDLMLHTVVVGPDEPPLEAEGTFSLGAEAALRPSFMELTSLSLRTRTNLPPGAYKLAVLVSLRYYDAEPSDDTEDPPLVAEWIYEHDELLHVPPQ